MNIFMQVLRRSSRATLITQNVGVFERMLLPQSNKRFYAEEKVQWPPEHIKEKMRKFQIDDGVPVYLKGGAGDRILFGITCVLCAIGTTWGLATLIGMARPKKQ